MHMFDFYIDIVRDRLWSLPSARIRKGKEDDYRDCDDEWWAEHQGKAAQGGGAEEDGSDNSGFGVLEKVNMRAPGYKLHRNGVNIYSVVDSNESYELTEEGRYEEEQLKEEIKSVVE